MIVLSSITSQTTPLVRANLFNSEPIIYENHVKWFNKVINDSNILFFLVFEDDDFVGQLRFVRSCEESKECVISLSITPEYRGKHIGQGFRIIYFLQLFQGILRVYRKAFVFQK